jgi:hypothetical protein
MMFLHQSSWFNKQLLQKDWLYMHGFNDVVPCLQDCLDNFRDQNEFCYVSRDADDIEKGKSTRKDDKWWLPAPKVPPAGLSEMCRKFLQYQKDCVNQVLKAAMAINAQVLSEMEIPENYIESLPKVRPFCRPKKLYCLRACVFKSLCCVFKSSRFQKCF